MLRRQQRLRFLDTESAELQSAHCPVEHGQLRRRLAAGHHQAALVRRTAHSLQQPTVPRHALAIAALLLAWLEERLGIVQHEQAPSLTQQVQQCQKPLGLSRRRY